jgi:hypothetical protein
MREGPSPDAPASANVADTTVEHRRGHSGCPEWGLYGFIGASVQLVGVLQ